MEERRADRSARRRAGHGQGQYRDQGRPLADRHRGERHDARARRRAAGGATARGGRDPVRQDDDAGLRHALVRPLQLPSARAQSLESRAQSRRLLGRGGRRRSGGLWAAPCRHRHRRLGPPAGRLVRHFRTEAERRPHPDRSALYRAGRRADDARRRRRSAADGDAGAPRRARLHGLPPQDARLGNRAGAAAQSAHRPDAGRRLRRPADRGRAGRGRGGGARFRTRRGASSSPSRRS